MKYIIEGILGEGAMAVVYRARHRELGSLHAIKKLKVTDGTVRERLVQEGRLQSSLQHPNVLSVTDLLTIDGCPALVMEYVHGPTLADFLKHHKPSMEQCDALARDILRGVAAAHSHGMVHRDLKPGNILIAITEDSLVPKIADFGLAKVITESTEQGESTPLTKSGVTMGTPAYMAPEQINDFSSVDERADVFSLGAILYELVSGTPCFGSGNVMEIWSRICQGQYAPLLNVAPELPNRITSSIEDALILERQHRVQSVAELLERWSTDQDGNHITISQGQSMEFWPTELRSKMSALTGGMTMVDTFDDEEFEREGATVELPTESQTQEHTRDVQAPGTTQVAEVTAETVVISSTRSRAFFGVALLVLLGVVGGVVFMPQQESASLTPEKSSVTSPKVSPSVAPSEDVLVQLETSDQRSQDDFQNAVHNILDGDYIASASQLEELKKNLPSEPAITTLMAVNYFLLEHPGVAIDASRKGAELGAANKTEMGDLAQLMYRSWRGIKSERTTLLPKWKLVLDANNNAITELFYLVSVQKLMSPQPFLTMVREAKQKYPKTVAFWHLEVFALGKLNKEQEMLQVAQQATLTFPNAKYPFFALIDLTIKQGNLEEAKVLLQDIAKKDPGNPLIQKHKATIAALQNDDLAMLSAIMSTGESDAVPKVEDIGNISHQAVLRLNQGKLHKAEAMWRGCIGWNGTVIQRLACAAKPLDVVLWTRADTEKWQEWLIHIDTLLSQFEVAATAQRYYTLRVNLTKAVISARNSGIGLGSAELKLLYLQSIYTPELPFEMSEDLYQELSENLFTSTNSQADIKKQIDIYAQRDGFGDTCSFAYMQAKYAQTIQNQKGLIAALTKIVDGKCKYGWEKSVILQHSQLWLARLWLAKGDKQKAREYVERYRSGWPNAADSSGTPPQVIEAQRIEAKL